jgi:hypothetical protein
MLMYIANGVMNAMEQNTVEQLANALTKVIAHTTAGRTNVERRVTTRMEVARVIIALATQDTIHLFVILLVDVLTKPKSVHIAALMVFALNVHQELT